jgi:hypothetical protein
MVRNVNLTDDKQLAVTTSKHYSVKSIGEMRAKKADTRGSALCLQKLGGKYLR